MYCEKVYNYFNILDSDSFNIILSYCDHKYFHSLITADVLEITELIKNINYYFLFELRYPKYVRKNINEFDAEMIYKSFLLTDATRIASIDIVSDIISYEDYKNNIHVNKYILSNNIFTSYDLKDDISELQS